MLDYPRVHEGVPAALRLSPSLLQVLAEVLTRVPLVHRLRCCALVCKAFHAASVLATREVVFTTSMSENSHSAGIRWLQAHGQAAGVTSIVFRPNSTMASQSTQQLPWDQLAALQELELSCAIIPPLPAAVLTSLTHLHSQSGGSVDELVAFTQLRHLALAGHSDSTGSQLLVFQRALPHLQALTHLSVSNSLAQDAALQGLQELTCLQELQVTYSTCTAALFETLPASLTRLQVECEDRSDSQLELPLSSTTHLQRLTALQHFALSHARAVHPSVLAVLTALTQLDVTLCTLVGRQEAGWHELSRLANLQHLDLSETYTGPGGPQLTAADIAALTAPSQLSHLHISSELAPQEHFKHLLPANRQLHSLKELYASMDLAADPQVMAQLPHCCPNLQVLDLLEPAGGQWEWGVENELATLCQVLGALPDLRTLQLYMPTGLDLQPATWEALARVDQLHSLGLISVECVALDHLLKLTTCAQLTRLMVGVWEPLNCNNAEHEVINEAPAGCQSDVWHRVPQVLLNALQWCFEAVGDSDRDSLAHMAHTAAGIAAHAVEVTYEQQEEVQELQQQLSESLQQVGALQQQLAQSQGQVGALQQHLAQSQEQVGALQQQLQAMRIQLQLQQQQQQQP